MKKAFFGLLLIFLAICVFVGCKNEVKIVAVESVSLNTTATTLTVGGTTTLKATVLPENATDKTVRWETSDEKVATVDGGKVTAVAAGKATIKATAGEKYATCDVTVNAANYLKFTVSSGDVFVKPSPNWNATTKEYSTDGGANWKSYDGGAVGGTSSIMFRGLKGTTGSNGWAWEITGQTNVSISGDIMTLLDYTDSENVTMDRGCFYEMFAEANDLVDASKLILSATTLSYKCYGAMFYDCENLVSATDLPATILAKRCYKDMFNGCSRLTKCPSLPATTLTDYCYKSMFEDCTSLKVNTSGDESNKIFTCTSIENDAVTDMFAGTDGLFTGTPESGKSYYWY